MHPAYGAIATVAGACVTVLKALFKGDELPNPVRCTCRQPGRAYWCRTAVIND